MVSSSRLGPAVAAAMTFAMVVAQVGPAWAQCTNDVQCKGDRICEKGACVTPPPKAPPAATPPPSPTTPMAPPPNAPLPAPSPPDAVRVTIDGKPGDHLALDGKVNADCRAPCTVSVPPGLYTLRGRGFDQEVDIPPGKPSRVEMKRGCKACWILGGIFTPLGIPFIAGGAVLLDDATKTKLGGTIYTGTTYTRETDSGLQAGAIAMIVSGVLISTTGIVFLILGGTSGGSRAIVNGESGS